MVAPTGLTEAHLVINGTSGTDVNGGRGKFINRQMYNDSGRPTGCSISVGRYFEFRPKDVVWQQRYDEEPSFSAWGNIW